MGGTVSAAELLADLTRHGIRLEVHGDRLRYHPRSALSPDQVELLKANKDELLALLGPTTRIAPGAQLEATNGLLKPKPVCRCGSTTWRDVPIHGGASLRRDCSRCNRFLAF